MRTTRSLTSDEKFVDVFMAPYPQRLEPPRKPGRFNAFNNRSVFARPMALRQLDFLGIRLIQGRVINHQHTPLSLDLWGGFLPQRRRIRFLAMQQAGKRIIRRRIGPLGLHPRRLRRTAHLRRPNQKIDIRFILNFRSVHGPFVYDPQVTA